MKKFTRLWQLMIVLVLSSGVLMAQKSNVEPAKKLSDVNTDQLMKQKELSLEKVYTMQKPYAVANEMTQQEVVQAKAAEAASFEKDPNAKQTTVPPSDYLFDPQFNWPLVNPEGTSVGIETDGNFIYTCHWQDGNYYRYDMDGNYIETFTITGASLQRDIAYNPNNGYFYGAAASTTVWEMDFTQGAEALVSTITAPTAIRACGFDDVNGYLFGNNWSTDVNIFDLTGTFVSSFVVGPVGSSYYGFAFDNYSTGGPFIWGNAQIDVSQEWLVQMTYPAGVETGVTFDVGTYFGFANLAGGLAVTPPGTFPSVAPGEWSLFGISQNLAMWALELDEPNPCSAVVDITAANITGSSLDLGWTEVGTSTSWEVEYGMAGFTQGTGTTISPATNPQAITGLSAATGYDFYVRADCGGGSYSAWLKATFTTAGDCEWYIIGYDSYGDGWNGGSVDVLLNGTNVLNWAGPAAAGPETVYFPMVDASTVDIVWNPGSWDSEVTYEVYDNTDVLVFSDGPNPVGTTTSLAGYCTTITCPAPTAVEVSGATGTQADLSWDDANAANTYDIVWGLPGFDPEVGPYEGTAYGETYAGAPYTYTLTGLTLNASYDVYVRASCGPGDVSIWAGVSFVSSPPPANDDCVNADLVTGPYPQVVMGTTYGATVDCPGVLDWNAVWYEVTLPYAVNNLNVDYCGTADQATIGIVYYNDCSDCAAYTIADFYEFYDCGTPGGVTVGRMDFFNIPGPGTIFFPVYQDPLMDFTVTFDVTELVLPPNDDCANAEPIGEVVDLPFNTSFATADTYGSCMTSPNLWYNYTATMDGDLMVSLCGSSYDTKLTLWDSFDCGTMVEVACNDDSGPDCSGLQSSIAVPGIVAGQTYKIEVGGYSTNVGEGILNVTVTPPMYDVTGTIAYANMAGTAMDAVTVELPMYGTSLTNGGGMYGPLTAPDGDYTLMSSTSKAHGGLNGLDIILTKRYIGSLHTFTPIQAMAADVNQNGGADGLDVIMMKRRLGSLTYPAWTAPDYIFYDENVTIAGAPITHDYEALCSGDVNGSHTPEFQIPAEDDCATPVAVTGPYPVTGIVGSTEFATESCPSYLPMASGEVWYAIDLPYANNTLVIDLCGDALMDNGWIVGTTVQCSCDGADYITAASFNFLAPCVEDLTWTSIPGPGTFYYPVATGTYQEGFTLDVDVTEYFAALGADCSNPFVVTDGDLPYVQTGLTTLGFGDDYNYGTDPGMCYYYGNGEDYVIEYTPAANITVDIVLTNTDTWTGINVSEGCPDVGTCVGYAGSSTGNPSYLGLALTGGVTYYIVIGTWPSPDFTPFDISITEVVD